MALRHYVRHHQDVPKEDARFTYEVLKFHRSAFDRQVHEALQIKWSKSDPAIISVSTTGAFYLILMGSNIPMLTYKMRRTQTDW